MATTPSQSLKAIVGAVLALLALLAAGASWWRAHGAVGPAVVAPRPVAMASASATTTIVDPVSPERLAGIDLVPRAGVADWSKARPGFQSSRSAAERGGIEPCATQEVDARNFEPWSRLSQGQLLVPREGAVDAAGRFVLVIHLHGSDPVRRELVESGQRFVLYAITLDSTRSYAPLFSGPGLEAMVAEVETALSKQAGRPAQAQRLVLSAWSAGFVGVEAALAQTGGPEIAAVILIDGLHAPRADRSAFEAQLKPFVEYAARAARGERFMYVSHSSIDPPDFASTTECAHYVITALGGRPQPVRRADRFGLELVEYFSRGDLHVRGYAGNDKADHCAQLALLRDVYAALGRRWSGR